MYNWLWLLSVTQCLFVVCYQPRPSEGSSQRLAKHGTTSHILTQLVIISRWIIHGCCHLAAANLLKMLTNLLSDYFFCFMILKPKVVIFWLNEKTRKRLEKFFVESKLLARLWNNYFPSWHSVLQSDKEWVQGFVLWSILPQWTDRLQRWATWGLHTYIPFVRRTE